MRTFPSTDLKQTLGDVLDAASHEPIAITKHKKPRFVLMSIRDYEQRFKKDHRQAYAVEDMPEEHLAMLESVLSVDAEEDPK
ncbi:type II toxin-antitoxin system Phd/YefM family antitoxin [Cognatiyoonia sp. IB215182]|uniref:type II toxin-antitoxin system Phd/YefM family antitoxin n=1 Tax=Cognatiyoonia sp. IB215182 TaxID=3097353 RepID=UPI002A11C3E2|nr:type II toxin-antitoxin system Phd/YefM family antitoxin [Cognatiyoonia sp. IB215182]MDX8355275.1 type II toxin-antitoxin system Phd/YefM family antitoxin [Cognatiyoonia sp. IB215182]